MKESFVSLQKYREYSQPFLVKKAHGFTPYFLDKQADLLLRKVTQ